MLICSPELDKFTSKTLFGRDKFYCQHHNISMVKYMFNQGYVNFIKSKFKKDQIIKPGSDGVIDSIRGLLTSEYDNTSRMLINNLLKPF